MDFFFFLNYEYTQKKLFTDQFCVFKHLQKLYLNYDTIFRKYKI